MLPLLLAHSAEPYHHSGLAEEVRVSLALRPARRPLGPERDLVDVVEHERPALLQEVEPVCV